MNALFGRKVGMTRLFAEDGAAVPVTLLEAGPNVVVQVKSKEKDGYDAVQIGFGKKKESTCTKPMLGVFAKAKVNPLARLGEVKVDSTEDFKPGQEIGVGDFKVGERVNVTALSKGLGFQGGVRRHGFRGGPKTHGQSDRWRAPGSIGQSSYPSRVYKGLRMPGRMGGKQVTVRNLLVIMVDEENKVIAVRGAVPGKKDGFVRISKR
jgi:large subunit ribosomal protein L3